MECVINHLHWREDWSVLQATKVEASQITRGDGHQHDYYRCYSIWGEAMWGHQYDSLIILIVFWLEVISKLNKGLFPIKWPERDPSCKCLFVWCKTHGDERFWNGIPSSYFTFFWMPLYWGYLEKLEISWLMDLEWTQYGLEEHWAWGQDLEDRNKGENFSRRRYRAGETVPAGKTNSRRKQMKNWTLCDNLSALERRLECATGNKGGSEPDNKRGWISTNEEWNVWLTICTEEKTGVCYRQQKWKRVR